ncbi:MAG: DUF1007 family protein [Alphaproteobacteria bacterium]
MFGLWAALLPGSTQAHPHVFVNNVTGVVFEQGKIVALKMEWDFDEVFSMLILEDFDKNKDKHFDAAEMKTLEEGAFSNLRFLSYFTHIRIGAGNPAPKPVEHVRDFNATVKKGIVHYSFTVPLEAPVDPRDTPFAFSVYDDSFYVAVEFDKNDPIRVAGSGSEGCHYAMGEDKENPIYFGMVFPLRVELRCAAG